ncbi:MAG: hypothetical protein PWP64_935 [Candidatus Cloacimonadota bacterium]|nr:hypothetical protein [Candidatus Cloacimonadota bacterium]
MKAITLIVLMSCLIVMAPAQEGPAYANTKRVTIKDYTVKQLHGDNILTLQTQTTGFYDDMGNLTEKYIMQGNLTYLGKEISKIKQDPWFKECLKYNYMNLLSSRSLELQTGEKGENTYLEYDNKGKLLKKTESRILKETGDTWEFHYNQVGYVYEYYQVVKDSTSKIIAKKVFDYFDDLQETHYYVYNKLNKLQSIHEVSPSDSLICKRLYEYDEAGNLLKESLYDHQEQILEATTYAYDEQNRLLQSSYAVWHPRFGHVPSLKRQTDYFYD